MRKFFSVLLAAAMTASLAACSGGGGSTSSSGGATAPSSSAPYSSAPAASTEAAGGGKTVLKFLHKWPQPENIVYFQDVTAAYQAAHPDVEIKAEAVADEPIKDKLRVLMGSADQPDVFFSWSGEFANKFIAADAVYDLTEAMDANGGEWRNSFMKAGLEPFSKDGKVYGVPLRINGKFMIYHKEIFDQYGLTEPTTWTEFENVCETLKSNGVTPIAFGNMYPWAACHYITGLNQKCVPQEVRMKDYNRTTGEYTDPGYIEALNLFNGLNDKGYFNEFPNSKQHDMAQQTWAQGQEAMFYVELEEFKTNSDNIEGQEWGFFALPAVEDGKGSQNYLTGAPDGFLMSKNSKNPELAIDFLKFLSSKENAEKLVQDLAWPTPVIGAVNESNSPEYLVKGMDAIAKADGMALWLDTDIDARISDVYLPGLQEIINGTMTPEQLMEKVQAKAKEVAALPE